MGSCKHNKVKIILKWGSDSEPEVEEIVLASNCVSDENIIRAIKEPEYLYDFYNNIPFSGNPVPAVIHVIKALQEMVFEMDVKLSDEEFCECYKIGSQWSGV
ncbi:MAG: hypothetical protein GF317_04700 [Candidatus Lokiarchaeota archaeon]|nr:hypothetical protein [Candidatus Lokiarchaeota archaeon]